MQKGELSNPAPTGCPDGMDIWVPRTPALLQKALAHYGDAAGFVGVFGEFNGCGGCRNYAMTSDEPEQAAHWVSIAPSTGGPSEPWFIRAVPSNQPSGDYTAGCWLGFRLCKPRGRV